MLLCGDRPGCTVQEGGQGTRRHRHPGTGPHSEAGRGQRSPAGESQLELSSPTMEHMYNSQQELTQEQ